MTPSGEKLWDGRPYVFGYWLSKIGFELWCSGFTPLGFAVQEIELSYSNTVDIPNPAGTQMPYMPYTMGIMGSRSIRACSIKSMDTL